MQARRSRRLRQRTQPECEREPGNGGNGGDGKHRALAERAEDVSAERRPQRLADHHQGRENAEEIDEAHRAQAALRIGEGRAEEQALPHTLYDTRGHGARE